MDSFSQFTQLDRLLLQSRALWQLKAFDCHQLPWRAQFPYLADAIWGLDDDELDEIDSEQSILKKRLLPALLQDLTQLNQVWDLTLFDIELANGKEITRESSIVGLMTESELARFSAHIKGRKWQQICAFTQNLPLSPSCQHSSCGDVSEQGPDLPVLEWCAGKGHLGRLIAKVHGTSVTSLEWQASLCESGQAFANKWQLPQKFICADAFKLSTSPLKAKQHAVALHACGDLHANLLRLAAKANTQAISISPCCYHLIQAKAYQALSQVGQLSELQLSRHDLQMPLQQSVIASQRLQALRHQEIAWRLGFDSLQREITGRQEYLPIPSIKQSQLSGDFSDFCHWAADCKSVDIPSGLDVGPYLEVGRQRQRLTRRIDLVAHLFRPILEHWLLLDRVCFLQEQGYRVKLVKFCTNTVTPRNALIQAMK